MVATRLSNSIGLAYANTEACNCSRAHAVPCCPTASMGRMCRAAGCRGAGCCCRQPAIGLPVPATARLRSGRTVDETRHAARGDPARAGAALSKPARPELRARDTCGGSVRGEVLIVEVLTARQPMVLILKSPFPNPASTAGTSFTPDMSNPSRRERDDED
jgi:hypothetical protein